MVYYWPRKCFVSGLLKLFKAVWLMDHEWAELFIFQMQVKDLYETDYFVVQDK
jgi:hypothetical protein